MRNWRKLLYGYITSQAHRSSAGSSDGTRKLTGRILPKSANRVVAPLQVTLPQLMPPPQQTTPAQVSAGSFRKESRVSIYDQRRQPETGAVLQDMEVDGRIPFVTPREVRDIDLVLNGQGRVENQEIWLHRQLEYVRWMWTAPYQPKVSVSLMRQVVSQEPRLRPSEENRAFPPARRTLPRICDAPCNAPRDVTTGDNQAEDCDTDAGVCGEALHGEREVAQVATVQTRMAPSTCPAGQRTPPPPTAQSAHTCDSTSTCPSNGGVRTRRRAAGCCSRTSLERQHSERGDRSEGGNARTGHDEGSVEPCAETEDSEGDIVHSLCSIGPCTLVQPPPQEAGG